MSSRREPGIRRAITRAFSTGSISSTLPCTTSVGISRPGSRALVSCWAMARIWAMITGTATGTSNTVALKRA